MAKLTGAAKLSSLSKRFDAAMNRILGTSSKKNYANPSRSVQSIPQKDMLTFYIDQIGPKGLK